MTIRIINVVIIFLAFVFSHFAVAEDKASANVVLIYVDDQGWTGSSVQMDQHLPESKSDYYQTPNLTRFARQSMRFSNAYAPAPVCSPSRISIQTGKSPAQLGMTNIVFEPAPRKPRRRESIERKLVAPAWLPGIPESETTIAEMIKSTHPEIMTAHFGKWHLGSEGPGKHGYDIHDGDTRNRDGKVKPPNPKDTFGVSERAIRFLEDRNKDGRRFFMMVSYYAVHYMVIALQETIDKYEHLEPGRRHDRAEYAAMTEDLDSGVGRLLEALAQLGMEDNTYVFYTSDNGAFLRGFTNNLPLAKGKGSVWEGGIRVPFLVRGSGIEPNSVSHVPVIGWDLFPTVLDLMGIDRPLPQGVEGASLRDVLQRAGQGSVHRPREELVWHYPHYINEKDITPQSAIRLGDYKLIEEYESKKIHLYDLRNDLGEHNNLASDQQERAEQMRARLHSYLGEMDAPMPYENPDWRWWRFWRHKFWLYEADEDDG